MDPLGLTRAMRTAYDFIRKNGHGTAKHPGVTENSVRALQSRGLIEMYEVPTGYKNEKTWVAIPTGAKKPRKVDLPPVVKALPATVSAVLRRGTDKDGNPLIRARVPKNDGVGPQNGGYSALASGQDGVVVVSYVTPDDMDLLKVLDVRPAMLKRYAEVLRGANFEVKEDTEYGVLYVSK